MIRSDIVKRAAGNIAVDDMPAVIDEGEKQRMIVAADYPENSHWFILELMRSFQLCYATEENLSPRHILFRNCFQSSNP